MDTPASIEQWLTLAHEHFRLGRLREAEFGYRQVLARQPGEVRAYEALGFVLAQLGRPVEALQMLGAALDVDPQRQVAHTAAGYVLLEVGRTAEALEHFAAVLRFRPEDPDALKGQGVGLDRLRKYPESIASYQAALRSAPQDAEIHHNLGNVLLAAGRSPDALASYEEALRLQPQFVEALNGRGAALQVLNRPGEAWNCHLQALALRPGCVDSLVNIGHVSLRAGRPADALRAYDEVRRLAAAHSHADGLALMASLTACDWDTYPQRRERVLRSVSEARAVVAPLTVSLVSDDAELLSGCARSWVDAQYPQRNEPLWRGEHYAHERVRLAYLSADFHEHPVAYSLAGILERHDRKRFEVLGVSLRGDQVQTPFRERLRNAFDGFVDASTRSDEEIARLLLESEIDIAVDLTGHTDGARTGIFAWRAAPIQVNYLGYPGTLGADYFDYVIADPIVLPQEQVAHFQEQVAWVPASYLPSDHRQRPPAEVPSRESAGLPPSGLVFCAFNNTCKITPDVFDIWLRLLRQVDGAVLWLSGRNPDAMRNLRARAEHASVRPDRLVFSKRQVRLEDHLARNSLADVFLDTFPYNAHATALDALWAGVPIITCRGGAMAARASASLLQTIGMGELVTGSLPEYERLALSLAFDVHRQQELRERLAAARAPLFDSSQSCRGLERAYLQMHETLMRSGARRSFRVEPS
jgi:protein O-GlcNAc transferase